MSHVGDGVVGADVSILSLRVFYRLNVYKLAYICGIGLLNACNVTTTLVVAVFLTALIYI